MKSAVKTRPYLTNCGACGAAKLATDYHEYDEVPAKETSVFLCDSCRVAGRAADPRMTAQRRVYYKNSPRVYNPPPIPPGGNPAD